MRFVTLEQAASQIRGKTVAIVGSAPSCAMNAPGLVDSHEVVVRVNNYKTGPGQGYRTDVHYSFYGKSIRKTAEELQADGVRLCWCKCPDAKPIESPWHELQGKTIGIDFRYIYRNRAAWWFCDTFLPTVQMFRASFELLGRRVPTTGFAAILAILECDPAKVFLTGFDFFASGKHNVNEKWNPRNPADPIGHRPELELTWLVSMRGKFPLEMDETLERAIAMRRGQLKRRHPSIGITVPFTLNI